MTLSEGDGRSGRWADRFKGLRSTEELRARLDALRVRALDEIVSRLAGRPVRTTPDAVLARRKRIADQNRAAAEARRRPPKVEPTPEPPPEALEPTEPAPEALEPSEPAPEAGKKKKKRKKKKRRPKPVAEATSLPVASEPSSADVAVRLAPRGAGQAFVSWRAPDETRAGPFMLEIREGPQPVAHTRVDGAKGETFVHVPIRASELHAVLLDAHGPVGVSPSEVFAGQGPRSRPLEPRVFAHAPEVDGWWLEADTGLEVARAARELAPATSLGSTLETATSPGRASLVLEPEPEPEAEVPEAPWLDRHLRAAGVLAPEPMLRTLPRQPPPPREVLELLRRSARSERPDEAISSIERLLRR